MATSKYAVLGIIICTILTAVAQTLMKQASGQISLSLGSLLNPYLILGVVTYAFAVTLLIISLKHGELSILYPIIALSFVLVALISYFYLNESINNYKTTAIIFILIGVSFLGRGSKK